MNSLVVYCVETLEDRTFEISNLDLEKWQVSKERLTKALDLEIIYDQIVGAYWDYKNKVNYWNLRAISKPHADYTLNHEIRSSLNSLAFNLLNLGKFYLDWHFNKAKNRCFAFELTGVQAVKDKVISQREDIFDTNLNYVIACNLRGHSQHSTLPVKSFTSGIRYDQKTSNRIAHFNIYYCYDDLLTIGAPAKRLSTDMRVDLTDIIDGFMYAISQKHMLNREVTSQVVSESRNIFMNMWKGYIDKAGFKNYSCDVIVNDSDRVWLSLDWFGVYDYLNQKHGSAIDYSQITLEK